MQKVIIDTNVLVSALIQRGYPYRIIHDRGIQALIFPAFPGNSA